MIRRILRGVTSIQAVLLTKMEVGVLRRAGPEDRLQIEELPVFGRGGRDTAHRLRPTIVAPDPAVGVVEKGDGGERVHLVGADQAAEQQSGIGAGGRTDEDGAPGPGQQPAQFVSDLRNGAAEPLDALVVEGTLEVPHKQLAHVEIRYQAEQFEGRYAPDLEGQPAERDQHHRRPRRDVSDEPDVQVVESVAEARCGQRSPRQWAIPAETGLIRGGNRPEPAPARTWPGMSRSPALAPVPLPAFELHG